MDPPQHGYLLSDEATPDDELGRAGFVTTLTDVLATAGTPLVVALYGSWGSGKTSMMLRLREQLDSRRSAATVWFDSWAHSNDDQPAVSLLYAIRKDLKLEKNPDVKRALLSIAAVAAGEVRIPYLGFSLGGIASKYKQLAKEDVERRSKQALLRSRFEEVIESARAKHKGIPIVVFIDDLDRCEPATAVAVLEAIKIYLNLPGCIFVLGVDRQALEAAISIQYSQVQLAQESYLDKIVQVPFTIPALPEEGVDEYIIAKVPARLKDCQNMLAAAAPDNPRQLKRIINSLFLLDRIATESTLPDYENVVMCKLALIQIAAPDLYQHLRQSPEDWKYVASLREDAENGEPRAWLSTSLTGSGARIALYAALTDPTTPATATTDIRLYLTLSEQVTHRPPTKGPRDAQPRNEPADKGRLPTDGRPRDGSPEAERTSGAPSGVAKRLQRSVDLSLKAGRPDEAVSTQRAVVESFERELDKDHPTTWDARTTLAGILVQAEKAPEAAQLYESAIAVYRKLTKAQADEFQPKLAMSLAGLSACLADLGQPEEALATINDAITIFRPLADAKPDQFQPNLAASLETRSRCLADLGQPEEALATINDAITIFRPLAEASPERYLPGLALSLHDFAVQLSAMGRPTEALPVAEEVVHISRRLAQSDQFILKLATSLNNLADILAALDRESEANAARNEAEKLVKETHDRQHVPPAA